MWQLKIAQLRFEQGYPCARAPFHPPWSGSLQEFYERVLNLINDYNAELYHELALAFECATLFCSRCLTTLCAAAAINLCTCWASTVPPLSCRYAWHLIFGEPPVLVAMPECDLLTCDSATTR